MCGPDWRNLEDSLISELARRADESGVRRLGAVDVALLAKNRTDGYSWDLSQAHDKEQCCFCCGVRTGDRKGVGAARLPKSTLRHRFTGSDICTLGSYGTIVGLHHRA